MANLSKVTAAGVQKAIDEFDQLGRTAFLEKYGFGEARSYVLVQDGRCYDSKAIVGTAYGFSGAGLSPLTHQEFSGGLASVAKVLGDLGFDVIDLGEHDFGDVPGISVGETFPNRRALVTCGLHREVQKGIWGAPTTGAMSIVISGGYEDDQDLDDEIIYTGEGGQDRVTRRQVADQELKNGNLALVRRHRQVSLFG